MNAWTILDAGGAVAVDETVIAPTANEAVLIAIENAGLDPSQGYVARRHDSGG